MPKTFPEESKSGFWDRGPVWISAVSGLIVALTGVAVLVVSQHEDTSPSLAPLPEFLGHYPYVDVPRMSGVTFTGGMPHVDITQHPVGADLEVWRDTPRITSRSPRIATLDRPDSDYQSCVSNKNPLRDYIEPPTVGTVGCFIGDGLVVGFKVVAMNRIPGVRATTAPLLSILVCGKPWPRKHQSLLLVARLGFASRSLNTWSIAIDPC